MRQDTRERLIGKVRGEGYDTMTACEIVDDAISRAKEHPNKTQRLHVGALSFAILYTPKGGEHHGR